MSRDRIDLNALFDSAQGVPERYGKAVFRMLDQLQQTNPVASEWHRQLLQFIDVGLPEGEPIPMVTNALGQLSTIVRGLSLKGATECALMHSQGIDIGNYAYHCFTQQGVNSYDERHRLVPGQRYFIGLIRWWDIKGDNPERPTTADVLRYFKEHKYSTQSLRAGMVPRLREVFTNPIMDTLRLRYIAVPHDPIQHCGTPHFLVVEREDARRPMINAFPATLDTEWPRDGAFAYL